MDICKAGATSPLIALLRCKEEPLVYAALTALAALGDVPANRSLINAAGKGILLLGGNH